MEIKKTICKGKSKAKGFGCGELNYGFKLSLCRPCYMKWLYTTSEGEKVVLRASMTAQTRIKRLRKETERKDKEKTIDWRKKLQSKVQEIARLIDKNQPCLAKGIFPKQMHGGHILSRGSNKTISLNLHNIHRQCAQSNHFQNDDGKLRDGLKREYGQEYYDFVFSLPRLKSINYSNIEYMEFYRKACYISNRMKKEDKEYILEDRIRMRNEINLELGIYEIEYCIFEKS